MLRVSRALDSSAVIPVGRHLFPFRTEKLSLPGPMVLGGQPPGRVGRRRLFAEKEPRKRLFFVPDSGRGFALDAVAARRPFGHYLADRPAALAMREGRLSAAMKRKRCQTVVWHRSESNRRRPTLPGGCPPSTIGPGELNFSVRNGKRCFPAGMTAELSKVLRN